MVNNMEVTIISKQTVKPSSQSLHHLKPYNLCLFDQLTPVTYPSMVFFYPITDPNFNLPKTLTHLRNSLSETLTLFYPFSGRTKNNVVIDDFHVGVLFLEAKVNCKMSEYFKLKDTESLNNFVPLHPFCKENETTLVNLPQIAFQVSIFACGGIALGVSLCHKMADGTTISSLLKSWAAIFSGYPNKVIHPDLSRSSSLFPPRDLPKNYIDLMDHLWFKESNYITRRFVFDAKSITNLKSKAKSESVPKPSRIETLTCFIWKHAMAASWSISGSPRTSVLAHAVNLRPRVKPPQSLDASTGNLFWWGTVAANPSSETELELNKLVGLFKEALGLFDDEFLESLQGEDGFSIMLEFLNQLEAMLSLESEKPDIFAFTSWSKSFFNELDFGWGKPFWLGVMGKVGAAFRNLVIFVDTQWGNGIEAWVTLEEKLMVVLENDPNFLAFAAPNPGISSL
ncbi:stemmadenine O-acetyltransferase [Ziziphus jujuba]|uniref:Stemmadenine O-acetyltransferase n=2 Tax=Ziziphus jujuba TaxID=326968 RepID=A0ABM3IEK1_ZIZJJ|nr:stemmadenine O-acetyltransferase [Ziziphus jujuba]KAH7537124.1 hypothetical protein FEM48_Zijuj03G0058500 [Ziziphus jujuba var. spinosa]